MARNNSKTNSTTKFDVVTCFRSPCECCYQDQRQQMKTSEWMYDALTYKTELCKSWEEFGSCKYGRKCRFAHGPTDLRERPRHPLYKTMPCKNFIETGACMYGRRCFYIHN